MNDPNANPYEQPPTSSGQTAPEPVEAETVEAPHPDAGVSHNRPTLTYGAYGQDVIDLVNLLAQAGHNTNEIARGTLTVPYLESSVMTDVRNFAREHGIVEAVENWVGREAVDAQAAVQHHVGPRIWAKLLEVTGTVERAVAAAA
jgi:hypothetical protein